MKSPKSNNKISVATKLFFEASCYDISANVRNLPEQLFGDHSIRPSQGSTLS
jgi:hypothetical protein